jgi:hypothetical protein
VEAASFVMYCNANLSRLIEWGGVHLLVRRGFRWGMYGMLLDRVGEPCELGGSKMEFYWRGCR